MKTLTSLFTLLFSIVAYGAVPLGTVPYAQLDTNDFGVTVAGHINTRLGVHTPSTPGDTWYLTINGTNINNGGTNFLQSMNPTAGYLPVRGAATNFEDSVFQSIHGNGIVGNNGSSAARTTNFLYIPYGLGTPVGVPTTEGGRPALYYDSTGDLLYAWNPATSWHIIGTNIFYVTNALINPTDLKMPFRVNATTFGDTMFAYVDPTTIWATGEILFDQSGGIAAPYAIVFQNAIAATAIQDQMPQQTEFLGKAWIDGASFDGLIELRMVTYPGYNDYFYNISMMDPKNSIEYDALSLSARGDVFLGHEGAPLLSTSTNGFLYVKSIDGTPTGALSSHDGGHQPITVDQTNHKLYFGSGDGSWHSVVGGSGTINPTTWKVPYKSGSSAFGDTGMHPTNVNDMVFDGAVYLTTAAYDQNQFTNVDGVTYIRNQPRITNAILSQVITLDGLAYNFPTSHDRAGSVLMDYDNAGTLTWSGSITNPLYNIYLSNVWVNGTMASGVNPTRWKVPYNADGTNFLDTGMHPTNTVDMVFDGDIFFGALTNRVFRNGTSIYYDNPNAVHSFGVTNSGSGGMAFMSIDATGDGANFQGGSLNSTWGIFDGSVGLIAYSNSKIDPTANGTIDFGSSSFLFKDIYSKRYFVGTNVFSTNSTTVTLNGVPIGVSTVTYAAVTNALLATGSASDVLHGDGSWGAGGGGGNMTNSGASVVGMVPVYTDTTGTQLTPTNSLTLTGTLTVTNAAPLTTPALEVFGGERHASFYTSTNYTASITNYSITLGAACTNTLLSATTAGEGFWLHVKALAGGGEIWVQNGDFLDNVTNLVLAPWSARSFKSDGTNTWEIH